ncbi:MAG: hypothetical protein ACRC78_11640 [Planktothrix sp.]
MSSSKLITITCKLIETKPLGSIARSHLVASLQFQGELWFKEAAYHLNEAGYPDLGDECLKMIVNLKNPPTNGHRRYHSPCF